MRAWEPDPAAPASTAGTRSRSLGGTHDGPPARLRVAARAHRAPEPAGAVVAPAPHSAAATPHPLPADAAPFRHRPEGRDAGAHTLVADVAAADARRARDHRRRRAVVEPAG